jgi:hypothetical protein
VVVGLAISADAQTGAHGYAGGGIGISECAGGCPTLNTYDNVGLIGGGYALALRRGRLWIAGDVNSRISNGYFDASGGPAFVFGLRSPGAHHVEPFLHSGYRFGEDEGWNVGTGANIWTSGRLGWRIEYQYQFKNTTFEEWDPLQPSVPPVQSTEWLDQHLIRAGIVIR